MCKGWFLLLLLLSWNRAHDQFSGYKWVGLLFHMPALCATPTECMQQLIMLPQMVKITLFALFYLARNSVTPSYCSWAHPWPCWGGWQCCSARRGAKAWAEGNWASTWWAGLAQTERTDRTLPWLFVAHFGHVSFEVGRNDFSWDQGMFEGPDE